MPCHLRSFSALVLFLLASHVSAAPPEPQAHLTRVSPLRAVAGTNHFVANAILTIYNPTPVISQFNWQLSSATPGVSFAPATGLTIAPNGAFTEVNILISAPASAVPFGQAIEYRATVLNVTANAEFVLTGRIVRPHELTMVPSDPVLQLNELPNEDSVLLYWVISNPTPVNQVLTFTVDLEGVPGAYATPVYGQMSVAAGLSRVIAVRVFLTNVSPGGYVDVIVSWDQNGDGVPEVGASSSIWSRHEISRCTGDLNGDGVVNGGDLGALLSHWGLCTN